MMEKKFILSTSKPDFSGFECLVDLDETENEVDVLQQIGYHLQTYMWTKYDIVPLVQQEEILEMISLEKFEGWHCHSHPTFVDWLIYDGPFYLCDSCNAFTETTTENQNQKEEKEITKEKEEQKEITKEKVYHVLKHKNSFPSLAQQPLCKKNVKKLFKKKLVPSAAAAKKTNNKTSLYHLFENFDCASFTNNKKDQNPGRDFWSADYRTDVFGGDVEEKENFENNNKISFYYEKENFMDQTPFGFFGEKQFFGDVQEQFLWENDFRDNMNDMMIPLLPIVQEHHSSFYFDDRIKTKEQEEEQKEKKEKEISSFFDLSMFDMDMRPFEIDFDLYGEKSIAKTLVPTFDNIFDPETLFAFDNKKEEIKEDEKESSRAMVIFDPMTARNMDLIAQNQNLLAQNELLLQAQETLLKENDSLLKENMASTRALKECKEKLEDKTLYAGYWHARARERLSEIDRLIGEKNSVSLSKKEDAEVQTSLEKEEEHENEKEKMRNDFEIKEHEWERYIRELKTDLADACDDLSDARDSLLVSRLETERLFLELEDLKEAMQAKEGERERLQKERDQIVGAAKEYSELTASCTKDLTQVRETVTMAMEVYQTEKVQMQELHASEIKEWELYADELEEDVKELESDIKKIKRELASAQEELKAAQKELKAAKEEIETVKEENEIVKAANGLIHNERLQLEERIKIVEEACRDRMDTQRDLLIGRVLDESRALAEAEFGLLKKDQDIADLLAQQEQHKQQIKEANKKMSDLEGEIEAQRENYTVQILDLTMEVSKLERHTKNARGIIDRIDKVAIERNQTIQGLTDELFAAKKALHFARESQKRDAEAHAKAVFEAVQKCERQLQEEMDQERFELLEKMSIVETERDYYSEKVSFLEADIDAQIAERESLSQEVKDFIREKEESMAKEECLKLFVVECTQKVAVQDECLQKQAKKLELKNKKINSLKTKLLWYMKNKKAAESSSLLISSETPKTEEPFTSFETQKEQDDFVECTKQDCDISDNTSVSDDDDQDKWLF